jgi:hypothetical protein
MSAPNIVPLMISNTEPSGTVSDGASHSDAYYNFDRNVSTRRLLSSDFWIQYRTSGTAYILTSYKLQCGDYSGDNTKAPRSWRVLGSHDGTNFTTLHTITNAPAWSLSEIREYAITSPGSISYTYFRLHVDALNSDYLLLGNIYFHGYTPGKSYFFNRVKETSLTTGTSDITVEGAVTGHISFDSVMGTGQLCYYCVDDLAGNWEIGLGIFTSPDQIVRTEVYSSSNSDLWVNFAAGSKDVYLTVPGEYYMAVQALL